MLNIITLQGRLTAAPELRTTPSGVATCAFCIAVERDFTSKGEERKADFINIVAWRQTAEFVCKYFAKGAQILVTGSLQTRHYEDKAGAKRTAYEVVAERVNFCGGKSDSAPGKGAPQPSAPYAPQRKFEPVSAAPDDFTPIDDDGDLPF